MFLIKHSLFKVAIFKSECWIYWHVSCQRAYSCLRKFYERGCQAKKETHFVVVSACSAGIVMSVAQCHTRFFAACLGGASRKRLDLSLLCSDNLRERLNLSSIYKYLANNEVAIEK